MKLRANARFSTVCLHAGQEPDPTTGAIVTPIYQTSTYVQEELGRHKGYEYARTQNPTRAALEGNLAAIESGKAAFAFASGMAAIGALASMMKAGDHVVVTDNVYGGTFRFFEQVMARYQLDVQLCRYGGPRSGRARLHAGDAAAVRRNTEQSDPAADRLRGDGRARSPPRRRAGRGQYVREPCIQRPIELGADLVDAQHHEVPERSQRQRGRRRDRRARRRHRVAEVRAERRWRDSQSVRLVAGAARHEDAAPPDGRHSANGQALAEFLEAHRRSHGSTIRGSRHIRSTSWRSARCAASAGWWRSTSARSDRGAPVAQQRPADGAGGEPRAASKR